MWCKDCRQDVPALLSGDKQTFCCPRCGGTLCAEHESKTGCQPVQRAENDTATGEPPPCYDGWEMCEELSEIGRALRGAKRNERQSKAIYRRESMRLDHPHADLPLWHAPAAEQPSERRKSAADKRGAAPSALTWLSLALGTTGFVCGGVLMGWSLVTGRQELWTIGVPVALVGQIALLVGLVLQLDRMWRDNRRAAAKLDNVDEQLRDLKTAATLLSTSQGPASTTFYSHFAGGAGPQLLLTDLKSQLDLLAMRIARDER
ncbi:MAG: hypothetical protein KKE86_16635 [Planctomycetes bacterium]|nr:hypothetical protein [Planctomycetota bacterium]MBU4400943.1 hypothetical protein [Planctomycetota bacterium]MCG2683866.1 hypothetical protein [Planctomycetales bacterium]